MNPVVVMRALLVTLLSMLCLLQITCFSNRFDINRCRMTYMYQTPQYSFVDADSDSFHRPYRLFVYGEGKSVLQLTRESHLSGIPVLFLPGNAGSYKQVRSLASVSLMKSLIHQEKVKFNYFTVDFNEELTGIYGGHLWSQTDYALRCVKTVLKIHDRGTPLIIIGHSMGGMVAKALYLMPDFPANKVVSLITLATPHKIVVPFDSELTSFYQQVDSFWSSNSPNVTLISIGGGDRDTLVPASGTWRKSQEGDRPELFPNSTGLVH